MYYLEWKNEFMISGANKPNLCREILKYGMQKKLGWYVMTRLVSG